MTTLSQILFWLGVLSIPLAWLMWWLGPKIELGRRIAAKVTDPGLREAIMEAHGERWGIFVGQWPATLLILSYLVGQYK